MARKKGITIFFVILSNASSFAQNSAVTFKSSDTAIERAFTWAKAMALHYKGDPNDPVGPWYEATLPGRSAFCMRDVSHQCIGAEILGMSKENKNMFTKFVSNISKSKDWCSYWEINKWNKPAPVDYKNDKEFWYTLDASFDVMYACWRLYLWTGDRSYIDSPTFLNFDKKTLNEYIDDWVLEPDSLITRSSLPNKPVRFDKNSDYNRAHGLPSYVETIPNMKMSLDLIAAIYQGFATYSAILKFKGDSRQSKYFADKAKQYLEHLESTWWDTDSNLYFTYYTSDGKFGSGEGESFALWFNGIRDTSRISATIKHLASTQWNMENTSYLPYLLYLHGFKEGAYDYLLYLSNPDTKRREYPEVSYGVIQGIVLGLMGIAPDARTRTISTCFKGKDNTSSELDDLPVLQSTISLKHNGYKSTTITNSGNTSFNWRVIFAGQHSIIQVGNKAVNAKIENAADGHSYSFVDIKVNPGQRVMASIKLL